MTQIIESPTSIDQTIEDEGNHIINVKKYGKPARLLKEGDIVETMCGRTTPYLGTFKPEMLPMCGECVSRYPKEYNRFWE